MDEAEPKTLKKKKSKLKKIRSGDDPLDYVDEVRCTIKYQMKKVLELNVVTVDSANMSEDDLSRNIQLSINFSISLLKSGWKNIKVPCTKTNSKP